MGVYKSFAVTVPGGSHIKNNIPCQDASCKYDGKYGGGFLSFAAAADGHGDANCFRSEKGARLAADCAAKGIAKFVKFHEAKLYPGPFKKKNIPSPDDFDKAVRDLVRHIIASWQEEVQKDFTAYPFTEEELEGADEKHRKRFELPEKRSKAYGTTLIAAAITDDYWFGIHIGDGRLTALYADGSFQQPVPWDERCYLNVTTSICDDEAAEQARHYFSFINKDIPAPVAVFLCTDGVDDNYPVDGNEKHLFKLYRTIALTFAKDGFASTENQLKDLSHAFATKGKGDDTSIAGVIDLKAAGKAAAVWEEQVANEELAMSNEKEDGPDEYGSFVKGDGDEQ